MEPANTTAGVQSTKFLRRLRDAETLTSFACARLLGSHLTGSGPAFSSTLATIALYDSSLRWFEACSCKPASRGPSPHLLCSMAALEVPKSQLLPRAFVARLRPNASAIVATLLEIDGKPLGNLRL